eukprot:Rhum_TRINITY_DN14334_c4_g3::Rhum_TRINITY_DN14334_c4_g3_i1::g.81940::m.81940
MSGEVSPSFFFEFSSLITSPLLFPSHRCRFIASRWRSRFRARCDASRSGSEATDGSCTACSVLVDDSCSGSCCDPASGPPASSPCAGCGGSPSDTIDSADGRGGDTLRSAVACALRAVPTLAGVGVSTGAVDTDAALLRGACGSSRWCGRDAVAVAAAVAAADAAAAAVSRSCVYRFRMRSRSSSRLRSPSVITVHAGSVAIGGSTGSSPCRAHIACAATGPSIARCCGGGDGVLRRAAAATDARGDTAAACSASCLSFAADFFSFRFFADSFSTCDCRSTSASACILLRSGLGHSPCRDVAAPPRPGDGDDTPDAAAAAAA